MDLIGFMGGLILMSSFLRLPSIYRRCQGATEEPKFEDHSSNSRSATGTGAGSGAMTDDKNDESVMTEELSRAESATNAWPEDAPPPMEIDESIVTEESDASDIVVRTVDEAGRDEMEPGEGVAETVRVSSEDSAQSVPSSLMPTSPTEEAQPVAPRPCCSGLEDLPHDRCIEDWHLLILSELGALILDLPLLPVLPLLLLNPHRTFHLGKRLVEENDSQECQRRIIILCSMLQGLVDICFLLLSTLLLLAPWRLVQLLYKVILICRSDEYCILGESNPDHENSLSNEEPQVDSLARADSLSSQEEDEDVPPETPQVKQNNASSSVTGFDAFYAVSRGYVCEGLLLGVVDYLAFIPALFVLSTIYRAKTTWSGVFAGPKIVCCNRNCSILSAHCIVFESFFNILLDVPFIVIAILSLWRAPSLAARVYKHNEAEHDGKSEWDPRCMAVLHFSTALFVDVPALLAFCVLIVLNPGRLYINVCVSHGIEDSQEAGARSDPPQAPEETVARESANASSVSESTIIEVEEDLPPVVSGQQAPLLKA